ncbi:hypothetical protein ACH5RR_026410 [Cinchona calisaya]|uniref:Uncharacterized protein n=1 Tax=Cinchona calisaya TaxID=153742 RepID=A0ABD2Z7I9_9GENT
MVGFPKETGGEKESLLEGVEKGRDKIYTGGNGRRICVEGKMGRWNCYVEGRMEKNGRNGGEGMAGRKGCGWEGGFVEG